MNTKSGFKNTNGLNKSQVKQDKVKKQASAKKSRNKSKFLGVIKFIKKLSKQTIPAGIYKLISKLRLSVEKMNWFEQRACHDFFSRLSIQEIVFLKDVVCSEKYADFYLAVWN